MFVKFVIDLTSSCGFEVVVVVVVVFTARFSMKACTSASICDGTLIVDVMISYLFLGVVIL